MFKVRHTESTAYSDEGKFYYTCPHCGEEGSFFLVAPVNCMSCFKRIPDTKELLDKTEYRLKYYFGKERD